MSCHRATHIHVNTTRIRFVTNMIQETLSGMEKLETHFTEDLISVEANGVLDAMDFKEMKSELLVSRKLFITYTTRFNREVR